MIPPPFFLCSIFLCISWTFSRLFLKEFTDYFVNVQGYWTKTFWSGEMLLSLCVWCGYVPTVIPFYFKLSLLNHEKILSMRNVLFFYVASIMSLIKNISQMNKANLYFCKIQVRRYNYLTTASRNCVKLHVANNMLFHIHG